MKNSNGCKSDHHTKDSEDKSEMVIFLWLWLKEKDYIFIIQVDKQSLSSSE